MAQFFYNSIIVVNISDFPHAFDPDLGVEKTEFHMILKVFEIQISIRTHKKSR